VPDGSTESFTSLPPLQRLLLPIAGAVILGLAFHWLKLSNTRSGLPHAVYVVNKEHARFPVRSLFAQFFGGIVALASGHSVGQEGPAVHLGAGVCARTGEWLNIPSNGLRVLAGCGTAAAISAAFNTPLAGVIFAMEVVLLEYTIAGFVPIIMAAVSATAIQRFIGGYQLDAIAHYSSTISASEILWLMAMAFSAALASTAFVKTTKFWLRYSHRPVLYRFVVAGTIVGVLALVAPQIMGTGTETLYQLADSRFAISMLALITLAKILATGSAIGLGIPGGLIGPSLVIGAALGGLFASLASIYSPGFEGDYALYVLLGMAAMMSAAINAPLAAIIFILELSFSSNILLPGLLVVVLANLFHQSFFKQPSLVKLVFDHQGLDMRRSSVSQTLTHKSVMELMDTHTIVAGKETLFSDLASDYNYAIMPSDDTVTLIKNLQQSDSEAIACPNIPTTASLMEAWLLLKQADKPYLACTRTRRNDTLYIGVISHQAIVDFLLK